MEAKRRAAMNGALSRHHGAVGDLLNQVQNLPPTKLAVVVVVIVAQLNG